MLKKLTGPFLLLLSIAPVANASLVLDQNRVIYPGASVQSAVVKISNPTQNDFLVQAWAEDKDGRSQQDIFVDPPLSKIRGQHKISLRIMAINPSLVNKSQEQLYWLNVKEIPKIEKVSSGAKLAIVMRTRIKILYRPKGVSEEMEQAYKNLEWKKNVSGLQVFNPTPYYITFDKVWLDNKKARSFRADMIPPFSTALMAKGSAGQAAVVNYTVINDFGDTSDVVQKNIN